MRELGYVYGQDFVTEPRSAESRPERYPELAAELVRLQVDVIVAPGPMLPAVKQTTSTIPVVMAGATDPIGQGLVQSLGRPGGNFTGLSVQGVTVAKRLELLKELVPGAAAVAVLWDPENLRNLQQTEAAARERGWKLVSLEVRDAGGIEVFPAAPAGLARRAGMERGHVLVRAGTRAPLQRFLPAWREAVSALPGRSVRWSLDVDPMGFL